MFWYCGTQSVRRRRRIVLPATSGRDGPPETKGVENLKKNADALRLSAKKAAVVLNDNSKIKGQITTLSHMDLGSANVIPSRFSHITRLRRLKSGTILGL